MDELKKNIKKYSRQVILRKIRAISPHIYSDKNDDVINLLLEHKLYIELIRFIQTRNFNVKNIYNKIKHSDPLVFIIFNTLLHHTIPNKFNSFVSESIRRYPYCDKFDYNEVNNVLKPNKTHMTNLPSKKDLYNYKLLCRFFQQGEFDKKETIDLVYYVLDKNIYRLNMNFFLNRKLTLSLELVRIILTKLARKKSSDIKMIDYIFDHKIEPTEDLFIIFMKYCDLSSKFAEKFLILMNRHYLNMTQAQKHHFLSNYGSIEILDKVYGYDESLHNYVLISEGKIPNSCDKITKEMIRDGCKKHGIIFYKKLFDKYPQFKPDLDYYNDCVSSGKGLLKTVVNFFEHEHKLIPNLETAKVFAQFNLPRYAQEVRRIVMDL